MRGHVAFRRRLHQVAIVRVVMAVGLVAAAFAPLLVASARPAAAQGQVIVGLITKTESNPFFVKMKEGAQKAADAAGVKLLTASGQFDTDNASQVTAIENMVTAGAKGILLVPADTKAIVPFGPEGAGRGRARDRARHPDAAAGRDRRAVRDRQLQGRLPHRPVCSRIVG